MSLPRLGLCWCSGKWALSLAFGLAQAGCDNADTPFSDSGLAGAAPDGGGGQAVGGGGAAGSAALGGAAGTASGGGGVPAGGGGATPGGAAGDAGSAGLAGTGGGAGSDGASDLPCSGKAYALCEDFEGGQEGGLPNGWTPFKGYGAGSPMDVVLAADEPHTGSLSLKSESQERGATRAQYSLKALGETAYRHWGRIFYKVAPNSPKPSGYFHVTFVSLVGPGGGDAENRVVDTVEAPDGTHQWLFNVPSDGCCSSSSYDWKFDADWHCAEWHVDATTHSYQFFHDSMEVPIGFSNRNSAPMSEYEKIVVGETYYQSSDIISTPFRIWFDDLAIDDERIGCE